MARTKQATPVRREVSSEYLSKHDRIPKENGSASPNGEANGHVARALSEASTAKLSKKEAGLVTLIIDVAGIYASL